ncbi:MAG: hypothetical protein P1V35_12335 [Planctomycetota bacterium]|nr:hypothetical protein [Planctomycetota bacterium]
MRFPLLLLLALSLAFASCSSEPQVESGGDRPAEPAAATEQTARTGPLDFTAPEGWTERAPTGAMRFKEYVLGEDVDGAPLVIVAHWPNGVGGLQANLQRWKGQVAGGDGAAEPSVETISDHGLISTIMDGEGAYTGMSGGTESGSRLLAAYIESPAGRIEGVYTIKLSGSVEALAPWAASFRKFIQDL